MKEPQKVLLVVGSFKGLKSSSYSMGNYLLEQLSAHGFAAEKAFIHPGMKSPEKQRELVETVSQAQMVILACPLYVDSLPAPVMHFMEMVGSENLNLKDRSFMVIINSGFPESSQNDTAIEICHHFAEQVGFRWLGGLPVGGGGGINGKPLEKAPGFTKKIKMALDLIASALVKGEGIPAQSVEMLRKPLIPGWMYRLGGQLGWYLGARKNKVWGKLRARPYA